VDWQSDTTFASCGSDRLVHVCALGANTPVRTFAGHVDEVNAIQWSPAKTLLASGSDDGTARLWSLATSDADGAVAVLSGHKKTIYSLEWSPTGEGSRNPGKDSLLAT
jgi:transducin (beta)-like 1